MKRENQLQQWLATQVTGELPELQPASSDASFRRYFRIETPEGSRIVMDAPPDKEDCQPFVEIQQRLQKTGLHVPEIHAVDLQQGFVLLEDLGKTAYLDVLTEQTVEALYGDALGALRQMQLHADDHGLPMYGEPRLREEMALFPTWLLEKHLGRADALSAEAWQALTDLLVDNALQQPVCLVHRDYHSRNLMYLKPPGINPGIIDFQDAVSGPLTYDLVSLLKDCYIRWPRARVLKWVEHYRQALEQAGMATGGPDVFRRWFDLMGVQRHLKAAGIFARLLHRDGKPGYIADIPRTLGYITEIADEYPELQTIGALSHQIIQQLQAAEKPAL